MIKKIVHIGPALNVQGGISSVLCSYKKLFNLTNKNFMASYNGSFTRSLPLFFLLCLRLLLKSHKNVVCYQIHTSSYGSFFRKYLISLCLRVRRKPYTVHIHGSLFDKFCLNASPLVKKMIASYCKNAACVICITENMKMILQSFLEHSTCFAIVPNPSSTIMDAPKELGNTLGPVKIVFSGRYGNRKGVFDLLNAFDKANFDFPVELHLFGDGEVEKVQQQKQESTKKDSITVYQWTPHSDYLKKLKEYDLLVLPSYAETFGMSLVEAMGCGIPVISTFAGGIPYVVDNGISGILIEPGDISALRTALEQLVNDKTLRVEMGHAAWERASTHFTGKVVLDLLENAYEDFLLDVSVC